MNQEVHWNDIADRYEDEIFDVFKLDKNKILPRYFKKHSNPNHTAIDFGCGVGKAFQYLSPSFKSVLATDISAECIALAKKKGFQNITYKRADLSGKRVQFPLADFAFCCNVIMLPEVEKNFDMIVNIQKALKPGGTSVIVLPSLESVLFSSWRLIDWYRKEGISAENIPPSELNYYKGSKTNLLQGIVNINGVPTKHYTQQEMEVLLTDAGLTITRIDKIEYDWSTEFPSPPDWMNSPYPWDWLVECKK